ncbi:MAG: NADH-quinone oxidoreductase subunit L, partial [Planctomycetes bacterium]|nr:NADH-quinone oxidoreductase subunit L [Planctomycetota bacterium]
MSTSALPGLLGYAVLLPLISFFLILVLETISRVTRGGKSLGKAGGWIATGSILLSAIISFVCLIVWVNVNPPEGADHGPETVAHADQHAQEGQGTQGEGSHDKEKEDHGSAKVEAGDYYVLGIFGDLRLTIGYYIDSLTVVMFCMVTLIATCIHFYAMGYMAEELDTEVTDHEVTLKDGSPLKRPGRFPRFFQYMSLFCFSMLGLVLAGNIAMTFVFWELVGICSYFLIGFYVERKSASNAANKAFIVNRIGDFGMIIGLMALWAGMGTFAFGDYDYVDEKGETQHVTGMFSQVRPAENDHQLQAPDGMVQEAKSDEVAAEYRSHVALANSDRDEGSLTSEEILINTKSEVQSKTRQWREEGAGYWLLIVAGVGIFCGCMGKSAQFPLHTWLPDAMEGPTPVSALVHSATMVAAGVYLVGRFYPVFPVEVLLIIAIVGTITLFIGASIAIAATDIKRVLAYSTISQLGYMMLALGVGGWVAGMMHLITHAFFKSLLFMCSGSVIHAVHTNELPQMGGLFKKMPVTANTMLVGCFAITGASIPFLVGLSGYYSKDAILEQANSFMQTNDTPWAGIFFIIAAGGA